MSVQHHPAKEVKHISFSGR